MSPPAAAPWTAREAINIVRSPANPQTAVAARKNPSESSSTRLRPSRAPSFPRAGIVAAEARTYALTTQETSASVPRSVAIVGSAVARVVRSSTPGNIANTSAANEMDTWDLEDRTRWRCSNEASASTPSRRRTAEDRPGAG